MIGYHQNSGNLSNPIISHSLMNKIDPSIGGHPTEFVETISREESSKKTPSMQKGDLLHAWIEHESDFVISEVNKPADKVNSFIDIFKGHYIDKGWENNPAYRVFAQKEYSIKMDDLQRYKDMFVSLHRRAFTNEDELKHLIYSFRFCREEAEFGGTPGKKGAWAEETVIEKIKLEGLAYLNQLIDSKGKIMMTKQEKIVVGNCYESVKRHKYAANLLDLTSGNKEEEFYWEIDVNGHLLKRKMKLDRYRYDEINNILTVVDLKTTSDPITKFVEGAYNKYKLGRQLFSYGRGFTEIHKIKDRLPKLELYNIVVQTTGQYPTLVYKTGGDTIPRIAIDFDKTLARIVFHIKSGDWNTTMEEQQNGGFVEICG